VQFNPSRYQLLEYLLAGLRKTGHSLIEYDGASIAPIFTVNNSVDDIGLFIIVPRLAHFFNLTINQTLNLFFYGLWSIGTILGLIGIVCLYRKLPFYCAGACGAFVSCCIFNLYYVREVYFIYSFVILSILPLSIFIFRKKYNSPLFYFFSPILGSIFGVAHLIRSYSSFGMIVWFLCSLAFLSKEGITAKNKAVLSFLLLLGCALPLVHAKKIEKESEHYLILNKPGYVATPHIHPHWHSFYLGFGFLDFLNPTGIVWADGWAFDEAKKIIPGIDQNDVRYDPLIKNLALNFMMTYPCFILVTLWAKIGILFYYLLRHINLAIFFIFRNLTLKKVIPILAGMAGYALFPLLAVPANAYTLGLVVFAYIQSLVLFTDQLIVQKYSTRKKTILFLVLIIISLLNSGVKLLTIYR
jgi:hypothetical protein